MHSTLPKVIYLQQLGRGTRKVHGKEALLVFDFIDNSARHNHSINLHRLLKIKEYRTGRLVLAPAEQINEEQRRLQFGEKVETVLPHNIFTRDYELVDLFNWQEEIKNMMSLHELAIELYVDDATARRWVDEGRIQPGPDLELPMGRATNRYFLRERLEEIRRELGIKEREPGRIHEEFLNFVRHGAMSASYKPVMLKGMLTPWLMKRARWSFRH